MTIVHPPFANILFLLFGLGWERETLLATFLYSHLPRQICWDILRRGGVNRVRLTERQLHSTSENHHVLGVV